MYFRCYEVRINDPESKGRPTVVAVRGDAFHALKTAMKYQQIDLRYGRRGTFDTISIKFLHGIDGVDRENPWKSKT